MFIIIMAVISSIMDRGLCRKEACGETEGEGPFFWLGFEGYGGCLFHSGGEISCGVAPWLKIIWSYMIKRPGFSPRP